MDKSWVEELGGWDGDGNIDEAPLFVTGPLGDYYLSQTAAGQDEDSPCVNAGSDTAENLGLDTRTTRTDQAPDTGIVDMGYHYPIVCPGDIDGDGDTDHSDLGVLLSDWGCPSELTPVYDTFGFEAYDLGDLPGQDGWEDDTTDPNYGMVQVVDDPTDSGMGQVIMLDPPGTAGGWLGAARALDSPTTARYVMIEWDQWRPDTGDNFWYADTLDSGGWWAMQWDQNGQASSYYFEFGVPITTGQWQHVSYIIDTVDGTATVDIDGEKHTSDQPDTAIDGIVFEMEPTEHEGDNGPVYADNLRISEGDDYSLDCAGDLDGDNDTDHSDLGILLADWGCGT